MALEYHVIYETYFSIAGCLMEMEKYDDAYSYYTQVFENTEFRIWLEKCSHRDKYWIEGEYKRISRMLSLIDYNSDAYTICEQVLKSLKNALFQKESCNARDTHKPDRSLPQKLDRCDRVPDKYSNNDCEAYKQSLEDLAKILPLDHDAIQEVRKNLAICLMRMNKYDESYMILKQRLEILEKNLHPEDAILRLERNTLATCLRMMGKHKEMTEMYNNAILKILGISKNPYHREIMIMRHDMAQEFIKMRRFYDAYEVYNKNFEIQKKNLHPEDPDTMLTRKYMATCLMKMGRYSEAHSIYIEELDILKNIDNEHPVIIEILYNILDNLMQSSEYASAYEVLQQILEIKNNPDVSHRLKKRDITECLGKCLLGMGKYAEACELFRQMFEKQKKDSYFSVGEYSTILKTVDDLVNCLKNMGKHADAHNVYKEILEILEQKLPPSSLVIQRIYKKLDNYRYISDT